MWRHLLFIDPSVSRDADPSLKGATDWMSLLIWFSSVSRDADPSLKATDTIALPKSSSSLRSVEMLTLH